MMPLPSWIIYDARTASGNSTPRVASALAIESRLAALPIFALSDRTCRASQLSIRFHDASTEAVVFGSIGRREVGTGSFGFVSASTGRIGTTAIGGSNTQSCEWPQ